MTGRQPPGRAPPGRAQQRGCVVALPEVLGG